MNHSSNYHMTFLATLAGLTVLFLGAAAYNLWAMPEQIPMRHLRVRSSTMRDIPEAIHLTVTQTGMAAVTLTDLHQLNFLVDELSPQTVQLTRDGQAVPFYVAGSGDEQQLYFVATAMTNTLEAPAVYQLRPGKGLAMAQHDATSTGTGNNVGLRQHLWEENSAFLAEANSPDPWYGRLLLARRSLNIPLNEIESVGDGRLQLQLWSNTAHENYPDHHVQVSLNGRNLLNWKWDGIRQQRINLTIPNDQLNRSGDNTLTLTVPGDTGVAGEAVYVDWVRLFYESELTANGNQTAEGSQLWFASDAENVRIAHAPDNLLLFAVADPTTPLALTHIQYADGQATFAGNGAGSHYYALTPEQAIRPSLTPVFASPPALQDGERGADYIAIYPDDPEFAAALRPLLDYRQAQGLRVAAVPLSQIANEFGYGRPSPEAIRDFLAFAATNWQPPAPRFLLLAGDASYDIHNWLNGPNHNLIPTKQLDTADNGYVSSDVWYTLFGDNPFEPQMAVGRFPAQTAVQLGNMVAKTITFEEDGGDWQRDALFVADDEPYFDLYTQQLEANLEANDFTVYPLHMSQDEAIHHDIMGALNRGVGLVNYTGDGSEQMWGDEGVLQTADVEMLANNGRPAIFTTFTANHGAFSDPQSDSLGESLLVVENGGAVAVIAPSARSLGMSQAPLADRFFAELLETETIGEALTQAKISAANDPHLQDAIYTFHLLGDPALRVVNGEQ